MSEGDIIKFLNFLSTHPDWEKMDLIQAIVEEVDTQNLLCTCAPISGPGVIVSGNNTTAANLLNVRLTAQQASNGVVPIPAIGSQVLIADTERLGTYVFMCSDIQEWCVYIDNGSGGYTSFVVSSGLQQFNDGSYNGLLIGAHVTQKLNALENLINDLIIKFNTHVHTGVTTGAGSSGPTDITEPGSISPITQESDIENPLITHGK